MARRKKRSVIQNKTQKSVGKTQPKTFRWGESYTSLLLGIIVVIVGVLFFVSLAKTQHIKQVTSIATNIISATTVPLHTTTTLAPTHQVQLTAKPSLTVTPTSQPSATPTNTPTPTNIPTVKPTNTPTPTLKPSPTATNTPSPTNTPIPTQQQVKINGQQTYTVAAGDDLWHIAEKFYKSGYNYIDIARANNLENPGALYAGTKLVIPQVTPAIATVLSPTQMPAPPQTAFQQANTNATLVAIKTDTYTIQKGDDLWDIAVRAYADGYKWTDIAKANNLTDPNLIHSGNTLRIPR